ncbi:MAG: polyphosphate polymerase domain-containing protein [Bacteroidota bacterium]|nr:polyphosphate polymerase domain-containing protein [Bacteroidota bacterium]
MESSRTTLLELLAAMRPITLDEMDSIRLMNRIDTKYCTDMATLREVLRDADRHGYRVVEVDGLRLCPYNSLYYDTDGLGMFRDHHNRKLTRQKVRTRVYVSSGTTFLEIKRKNNKGRTKKKRLEIPSGEFMDFRPDTAADAFLTQISGYQPEDLKPRLETLFDRITLVNAAMTERLTIDTSLRFVNHDTGANAGLGSAVIIELKQDGRAESEMKRILLDRRVKPIRVSKYCIGTTVTNPGVTSGRFKVKVRRIEKVINEKIATI